MSTMTDGRKARSQPKPLLSHRRIDLDNCKCLFMFYVVVYHFFNNWILDEATKQWSPFWRNFFVSYTLWHEKMAVPGFCFISGVLGKGYDKIYDGTPDLRRNIERWKTSVSALLVGPMLIQLFNNSMTLLVSSFLREGDNQNGVASVPNAIFDYDYLETWYLVALFGWRLLTPLFLQVVRYPFLTSLCLAFLHSHVAYDYSANVRMRFFRYFPFYVAGLVFDKSTLDRVPNPTLLGGLGMVLTLLLACLIRDKESFFSIHYFDFDWSLEKHVVLVFQYLYSFILVMSTLLLVRALKFPLFPLGHGNSTLAIYCWHWRVLEILLWGQMPFSNSNVQILQGRPALDYLQKSTSSNVMSLYHPFTAILMVHFVSYAICVALGSSWAWELFRAINDPSCSVLFRQRVGTQAGSSLTEAASLAQVADLMKESRQHDIETGHSSNQTNISCKTNRPPENCALKSV